MKGLLWKDCLTICKSMKVMLLFVAGFLAVGVFSGTMDFYITFAFVYLCIFANTLLTLDERCGWLKYAQSLPVSRKVVVWEKYILNLLIILSTLGLYVLLLLLRQLIQGIPAQLSYCLFMLALPLLYTALALPFSFHFGTEKGRLWQMIFIGVLCGGTAVINLMGVPSQMEGLSDWLMLGIPAVAAVLFFLSGQLSVRLFARRELR